MGRRASEAFPPARKARSEQRRDLAPHPVAGEHFVGIAFVLDPIKLPLAGVGQDVFARNAKQRPQGEPPGAGGTMQRPALRHARGAGQSRAPQQVEQHRFCLVVELVRERDHRGVRAGQCRIARLPGRRFQPTPAEGGLHPAHLERNAETLAQRPAEGFPFPGVRADAVIDMHRGQGQPVTRGDYAHAMQQRYGIDPAGERDADRRPVHRIALERSVQGTLDQRFDRGDGRLATSSRFP